MIIHISGPSGSGKTTLGNKLKEKFKGKIIVKDLDDLLDEHVKDYFGNRKYTLNDIVEKEYQKYIDAFIQKQKKPIIFVGLNDNLIDFFPKRKKMYYNLHAEYTFYIDIDDSIIVNQKCRRFLEGIQQDVPLMNNVMKNNKQFQATMKKALNTECNPKFILQWSNRWKRDYQKQGYVLASREQIYNTVVKILDAAFKTKTKTKNTRKATPAMKSKTVKRRSR